MLQGLPMLDLDERRKQPRIESCATEAVAVPLTSIMLCGESNLRC